MSGNAFIQITEEDLHKFRMNLESILYRIGFVAGSGLTPLVFWRSKPLKGQPAASLLGTSMGAQYKEALYPLYTYFCQFYEISPKVDMGPFEVMWATSLVTSILVETTTISNRGGEATARASYAAHTLSRAFFEDMVKHNLDYSIDPEKDTSRFDKGVLKFVEELRAGNEIYPPITIKRKDSFAVARKLVPFNGGLEDAFIPSMLVKGYVDGLIVNMNQLLRITYIKMGDETRPQLVTANEDIVKRVYKTKADGDEFLKYFTSTITDNMSWLDSPKIGYLEATTMSSFYYSQPAFRGTWRVADLGLSIFDGSPMRQISIPRIASIQLLKSEEDLNMAITTASEFAHVDMGSVVSTFKDYCRVLQVEQPKVFEAVIVRGLKIDDINNYEAEIDIQDASLTTVFKRSLHKLMISRPDWFPGYTGAPKVEDNFSIDITVADGAMLEI